MYADAGAFKPVGRVNQVNKLIAIPIHKHADFEILIQMIQ